ncbi:neuropeptide CCHamide-1 receptor-like [Daphnia pulex]|uniref:neuropeptide CCHamide-1 receptor-like n=1 Tax=Daphnia pulex TaxID=6669 RepID=UPI001EDE0C94|nr:neuropeptide CCHamide-1 receptor-like [Daphnia pulex]XP_046463464.1 neuropeptide CCHamide-1 receptor-like [Daphnia pulex]
MMLDEVVNESISWAMNKSNWSSPMYEDDDEDGYIEYRDRPETYVVPILFSLIFLVGVLGNGSLIYVLCRHKSMRSVPNTFIFNLALGDLLILIFTVPFTSTVYTLDSWPFGEFVCKASEFAKDTSVGVSVFTLTALSFDRYTAIVRPVQSFVSGPRSKVVIVCLLVIWVTSLILATPAAMFSHLMKANGSKIPDEEREMDANGTFIGPMFNDIYICYPFPPELGPNYPKLVILLRFLLHYCLPLLTIGTFYVIMAYHLLRSVQNIPGQATLTTTASVRHRYPADASSTNKTDPALLIQQQQQPNQNRARRKLAKMVLSFVVLFAVCFLPIHVFFLWFYFHPAALQQYNGFWHTLKIAGFVLAYINSCINPIALYCVSTSFRKHFNRLLCCCSADRDGSIISRSGPVSYCGGSMCAGNNSRGAGTALMSDDPTVITHRSNSRRQNTISTSVNRRNHNENHRNADAIPLKEIHQQQQPQAPLDKQSSC